MADFTNISDFFEDNDISTMNEQDLHFFLDETKKLIVELDMCEPEDEESEEYDNWANMHEALEDTADEIMDRLDELC